MNNPTVTLTPEQQVAYDYIIEHSTFSENEQVQRYCQSRKIIYHSGDIMKALEDFAKWQQDFAALPRPAEGGEGQNGIELISKERQEQITKHGYGTKHDAHYGQLLQLSSAAAYLAWQPYDEFHYKAHRERIIAEECPQGWNREVWEKMNRKPYKERLIIAGALIAAEIDRLDNKEANK